MAVEFPVDTPGVVARGVGALFNEVVGARDTPLVALFAAAGARDAGGLGSAEGRRGANSRGAAVRHTKNRAKKAKNIADDKFIIPAKIRPAKGDGKDTLAAR